MHSFAYAALAIALSLAACATAPSSGDGALVADYTPAFQAAAAAELAALPPACQPNDPATPSDCSPVDALAPL